MSIVLPPVTFKPHSKSIPAQVYVRLSIPEFFSAPANGCRWGNVDAAGLTRAFKDFCRRVNDPGVSVRAELLHTAEDDGSHKSHYGYDDNPELVVRGRGLPEVSAQIGRAAHLPGEGHNWVSWQSGISISERRFFEEAFNEVIREAVNERIDDLRHACIEQGKANIRAFIGSARAEIHKIETALVEFE